MNIQGFSLSLSHYQFLCLSLSLSLALTLTLTLSLARSLARSLALSLTLSSSLSLTEGEFLLVEGTEEGRRETLRCDVGSEKRRTCVQEVNSPCACACACMCVCARVRALVAGGEPQRTGGPGGGEGAGPAVV